MGADKIIGRVFLVDAGGAGVAASPGVESPLVAIAGVEWSAAAVLPAAVVAWVSPGGERRPGVASYFRSDTDLRPYFRPGDTVEIDLYQGMIRHLTEGYAFPLHEVK